MNINKIHNAILGLAVGDALGVPVEFKKREYLKKNPVSSMLGFGTHKQPAGTCSDDTYMTMCLYNSVEEKGSIDLNDIMKRFVKWKNSEKCFDIGNTCYKAITRYESGASVYECGCDGFEDNGNGALMRILPLAFYDWITVREIIGVCSLTHRHSLNILTCKAYVDIARNLLKGQKIADAIDKVNTCYSGIALLNENQIKSTGYICDTFTAALWCLTNTNNYRDCVLKAVNLGDDTDTVAAVAGGLAGIIYDIPVDWVKLVKRQNADILASIG